MRMFLAIIVGKLARVVLKLVGRGSSMPGQLALKICPSLLGELKMPKYVVAVTGSNGKTSTSGMIMDVLSKGGYKVAYNYEGSNQIEGVATLLIANATMFGRIKADVVLLESDERYARHSFKWFTPTHYIITNLYRDQLTRNGHPEWVYDILNDSIHDGCKLILNGDDPLVSMFGLNRDALYFSLDRYAGSSDDNHSVYDDGIWCPNCHHKLIYKYRNYNHIGSFACSNCNLGKNKISYRISDVDLDAGYIVVDDSMKINLSLKSLYNAYNILAVVALGKELGIKDDVICSALNNYILRNGRVVEFRAGENKGVLLASKHENSVSYDMNLRVALAEKNDITVFLMVDAISRKYFTSETSWLWDIDFELLNSANVKRIVLTGQYASDLAVRLEYAGVDFAKVYLNKDIATAVDELKSGAVGYIYALTCFSDLHKLLERVEVL